MQIEITKCYQAKVEEVHSGDDLILMVELGHDSLFKRVRARLMGVDTPDAYKADPSTNAGRIRDKVKSLTRDKKCIVQVDSYRRGGWIVTLLVVEKEDDPFNLNEFLKSQG